MIFNPQIISTDLYADARAVSSGTPLGKVGLANKIPADSACLGLELPAGKVILVFYTFQP